METAFICDYDKTLNADGDLLLVRPTASNVRVPLSVVQGTQNLKLPGPEGISLLPSLRQLYRR